MDESSTAKENRFLRAKTPNNIKDNDNDDFDDFDKTMLELHNLDRARFGLPPVKLSKQLCKGAQDWADKSSHGHSDGSTRKGIGENVAMRYPGDIDSTTSAKLYKQWSKEEKYWSFGKFKGINNNGKEIGHWTQIIWENVKEIGIGKKKRGTVVNVVARYSPGGNIVGQYPFNT